MKIIIAGGGKVGAALTRQLSSEGHDITLIDSNQAVLDNTIEKYDVISVKGNCATSKVLEQAGIKEATLLIAATSEDEINLLCCLTAHTINPDLHTIARIRNPEYSEQIYQMRKIFALSLTVNPERQAAREIEKLLRFPGFLKRDSFAKDRVEIVEIRVGGDSILNGTSLSDLTSIVKCQVLVCTVLRDGEAIMPGGSFILKENDRIFVTAPTNELTTLLKNLNIITHRIKSVMLAGGGRLSIYLARLLTKSGMNVRIIEKDYDRCVMLAQLLPAADIIHGDASSLPLLESEGISECDALVSLTGLDEMNMVISLYATDHKVPLVITKFGHAEETSIFNRLSIGSIISPRELCCNIIARYVRAMHKQTGAAVSVHSIAAGKAEAAEFIVDKGTLHCDEPLKSFKIRKNVLIVCITHQGSTIIPNGDSCFCIDDTVVVVTVAGTALSQLNDIFE